MRITSVEARVHAIPLPRPFHGSNYVYTHKKFITIRIGTDADIEGIAYLGDDFGLGAQTADKVETELAPALLGLDPMQVRDHWQTLRQFSRDILGDRRIGLHAQALVDIGLWDVCGKAQEKPLASVFGNPGAPARIIAIAGYYAPDKTLNDLADETRELLARGMAGVKLKVGGASLEHDIARVKAVRHAAGPDFLLAVDANQAWSFDEALEFADKTSGENLLWIEEPVHWDDDIKDLARLRARTKVAICAGQSEWTAAGAKRLIDAGAIDICNIHPGYCGGVTPWLEVADYAAKQNVRMANTGEPQLSAHLIPATENPTCVEVYHPDRDPVFPALCPIADTIDNGTIATPDLPGWGIVPSATFDALAS